MAMVAGMPRNLESEASLPRLVQLRWLALAGQAVALICAHLWFETLPTEFPLAVLFGLAGGSNLALARWLKKKQDRPSSSRVVGSLLAFDTLLLTGLLALSGGPMNPFTVLLLVYVVLAALVLNARWTLVIFGLCIACFAGLYFGTPHARAMSAAGGHFAQHLRGMWLAFAVASGLTAYFVRRIAATIAAQREHIATLREGAARNARLASLTTLAAGAAHELGTPLATIAVAAHELALGLVHEPAAVADARLISGEVERCHQILARMASRTGSASSAREIAVNELTRLVRARFDVERAEQVRVQSVADLELIRAPVEELIHSLYALIKNALDASQRGDDVTVTLDRDGSAIRIAVEDVGSGMASPVLARAGEPFFTTKDPGSGLGLGLFLTRAFAESQGGELLLESEVGSGTRATLRLPLPVEATA
jgi:two-component system, sensor histidine kinase RegB